MSEPEKWFIYSSKYSVGTNISLNEVASRKASSAMPVSGYAPKKVTFFTPEPLNTALPKAFKLRGNTTDCKAVHSSNTF